MLRHFAENPKWEPHGGTRGNVGIKEVSMGTINVYCLFLGNPIIVEPFQSGLKWWTDCLTDRRIHKDSIKTFSDLDKWEVWKCRSTLELLWAF